MVLFFDEGRFGLHSTYNRVWAKRGSAPTVKVKQGYKNFYAYSAVDPFNGEQFTLFLPEVNSEMMNIYLKELSNEYPSKNILLIMDQAGWHKSSYLITPKNIKFSYLPPYSPELNPVERLWKWLKKECIHNSVFETLTEIMDTLQEEYRLLTKETLASLCKCNYLCNVI